MVAKRTLRRLAHKLVQLLKDRDGAIAVIAAGCLMFILAFTALAIDMGYAYYLDNRLQIAADSSALAGVSQLVDTDANGVPDNQAHTEAAIEYAYKNMAEVGHGTIIEPACGTYDPGANSVSGASECDDVKAGNWDAGTRIFTAWDDPTFDGATMDLDAVRVRTHRTQATGNPFSTFFAAVFGLQEMDINNHAVAWGPSGGSVTNPCVLALDPNAWRSMSVSGSSNLNFNCDVAVNSSNSEAFSIWGESTLVVASEISIVGDYYKQPASVLAPPPDTYQDPTADFLGHLGMPSSPSSCTETGFQVSGGTATLSPGRYCDGLVIKDAASVTFQPGTYIVDGGEPGLFFKDLSTIQGDGVTFVLTGGAQAHLMGGTTMNLSAPTSGYWEGVLIYQDRNSPSCNDQCNRINGDSSGTLSGALYFPNQELEFSGSAGYSASCLYIVARTLEFSGDTTVGNECESEGYSTLGTSSGFVLRLVD